MKIDRLLTILAILLRKEQVTAPELAEQLEVTRRTIGRDIDDLCKAGFPIVTRQGAGGGISIAEGYKLDKNLMTKEELQNILIALKGLESVDATSRLGRLVQKLTPASDAVVSLKDNIVIDLASHYKDSLSKKINLLRTAIEQRRIVTFAYYSDKGVTFRTIGPYFIVFKWSAWYVFGYCMARQDFRMFKLGRLWRLNLTEEKYSIGMIPPEKIDFDAHLRDDRDMVILFDESVEYLLVEEYGPASYTKTPDGKLLFQRGYTNLDFTLRWILSFGDKAEVLAPADLRETVGKIILKTAERYN
ncbi:helix-turn-helix transcriptional regulator [Sporomusa acidovorans]|uniref:HTH deoR-type domain-containing protein n=1 Tax=Sporomusa acidovorans (strain ATCC 49682 / DSM 3132 / Mol) TaxID=1123286 RepID=A0ABZ3J9F4_SPOA4|nr:YafY family protein [Sporomusa acidovorans]OZC17365.1 HTH domain protein [Sporomusa acidovorans DSM 3132]OZC17386.1 HTH domain protein [Sporomusa acidovorans DSM 3132]SDF46242.1 Predicted DNA-binding transcriptional regulator YafY, contains an HTH and WYL domains [Sporomusa acidovorans]